MWYNKKRYHSIYFAEVTPKKLFYQQLKNTAAYFNTVNFLPVATFTAPGMLAVMDLQVASTSTTTAWLIDRKSTRLNSSHRNTSRMPSSA